MRDPGGWADADRNPWIERIQCIERLHQQPASALRGVGVAGRRAGGIEAAMNEENDKSESSTGGDGPSSLTELYEKMSRAVRESVERAGAVTEESLERALKEARELAQRLREDYGEDVANVSEFIKRDWHEAIRMTREQTRRSFDLDRLQAGLLGVLLKLAQSAGSQLESFANRLNERLTYKTGEIAGAGTLECRECGQHLSFEKATRIPPCPKCRSTVFRRSF
jgi:hypothetical protein